MSRKTSHWPIIDYRSNDQPPTCESSLDLEASSDFRRHSPRAHQPGHASRKTPGWTALVCAGQRPWLILEVSLRPPRKLTPSGSLSLSRAHMFVSRQLRRPPGRMQRPGDLVWGLDGPEDNSLRD